MWIEAEKLCKAFEHKQAIDQVSFSVRQGECFGIIGPNGSGKSTLLKLLSGIIPADQGEIRLGGKRIQRYSRKSLAQWMAVLQQEALPPVRFTVREVIEMGRYPFQNWLGEDRNETVWSMDHILSRLALTELSERTLEHLSGGERQRAALGKVMAQSPSLLLLDEPTTYLDIGHQLLMMDLIREWQQECGMTVLAVLHDLNLAALYCDRLLLIDEGKSVAIGTPDEILQGERILQVYGTEPIVIRHPTAHLPQILLQSRR
ncbi:ABC transporter ATP-binding protein [Marinicrinis sediminis]|uniref:ABC transporter ATP-binding protein n=1 Tax=Marinicrinis sediminis TaxID=1652465 RepID=A0ABW5R5I5_9BACL